MLLTLTPSSMIWCLREESERTLYRSFPAPACARFLILYIINKRVRPSRHFKQFAVSLFCLFLLFYAVCYQNTLTHIITSVLHWFKFPFASICAWRQHLCTQQASGDSQKCHQNGQQKHTENYLKYESPLHCLFF